jgi:hypothetical protein
MNYASESVLPTYATVYHVIHYSILSYPLSTLPHMTNHVPPPPPQVHSALVLHNCLNIRDNTICLALRFKYQFNDSLIVICLAMGFLCKRLQCITKA